MSFSSFVDQLLSYVNDIVIVLIGAGLAVFLYGLVKYVASGDDPKKKKEGRDVIIWGIIALSVMTGVWGFVNIIVYTIEDSGSGYGGSYGTGGGVRIQTLPSSRFPSGSGGSGGGIPAVRCDINPDALGCDTDTSRLPT